MYVLGTGTNVSLTFLICKFLFIKRLLKSKGISSVRMKCLLILDGINCV